MAIERWELTPSSQPDRYLLKVRGDKSDLERVVRTYARVCQEVREMGDPVFQWAVYVVGATLNERLSIQDLLREMVNRPAAPTTPLASTPDLSGVLSELSLMLEGLTDLTDEEQAHVAKKMEQRQREEAVLREMAPPPPAPVAPAPPSPVTVPPAEEPALNLPPLSLTPPTTPPTAPPLPVASTPSQAAAPGKKEEKNYEILHDVARPPKAAAVEKPEKKEPPLTGKPPLEIVLPPEPAAPAPAQAAPVAPPSPAAPPPWSPAPTPAAPPPPPPATPVPPAPVAAPPVQPLQVPPAAASPVVAPPMPAAAPEEPQVPADQTILTVCFYSPGQEAAKDKFIKQLTEVAKKKAKKPMVIKTLLTQATPISNKQAGVWLDAARSVKAECAFILLTPDILPDFLENAVVEIRQAGVHCFLVPQSELDSRILYVDLMVELMLVKRKR